MPMAMSLDSFNTLRSLTLGGETIDYYRRMVEA